MYDKNKRAEQWAHQQASDKAADLELQLAKIESGFDKDYIKRLNIEEKTALEELRLICETQSTIKTSKLKLYLERLENGD